MQLSAQTTDTTYVRTVVVEQEYNPTLSDAKKISVSPQAKPLTVSPKSVQYAEQAHPMTRVPADTLPSYIGIEEQAPSTPGYLRLGYGTLGQPDIHAAYRFAWDNDNSLNLSFRMDGRDDEPDGMDSWRAYFYHTRASAAYRHHFRRMDFDLGGHFGLSNFNLLPGDANPKQRFTSGGAHIGLQSADGEWPVTFRAETNLLFYQRQNDLPFHNLNETLVRTKAWVKGGLTEHTAIALALQMDNLFYNRGTDYTALHLNPHYLLDDGQWTIRLGVNVDLGLNYGQRFHLSPDVAVRYTFSQRYRLYLEATGQKLLNDFRRMERLNPYAHTAAVQMAPTYEQLNALAGFRASPVSGLWINLYGGYRIVEEDAYTGFLNPQASADEALYLLSGDADEAFAGATVSYDRRNVFALQISALYHHWSTDDNDLMHYYLKPRLELDGRMEVRPLPGLDVYAGYEYAQREHTSAPRAADVNNLYAGAGYNIFPFLTVYARLNNLLDRSYELYHGCPAEGFSLLGGVSFRF